MNNYPTHTDTVTHNGYTVKIEYFHDADAGAPWGNCDGHGNVTCINTPYYGNIEKKPGHVVLYRGNRNEYSYLYDFQAAIKTAKKEGWNAEPYTPENDTPGKRALRAVNADMKYLRGWCSDDWQYVYIVCTLLDSDGEETDITDSLCGVETYKDHHETEGADMARALVDGHIEGKRQAWRAALKEARARKYWASRDVETVGA